MNLLLKFMGLIVLAENGSDYLFQTPLDDFSGPAAESAWGSRLWKRDAASSSVTIGGSAVSFSPITGFLNGSGWNYQVADRISQYGAQIGAATLDQATDTERPVMGTSARELWPVSTFRFGASGGAEKFLDVTSGPTLAGNNWTFVAVARSDPRPYSLGGSNNFAGQTLYSGWTGAGNMGNYYSLPDHQVAVGTGAVSSIYAPTPNLNYSVVVIRTSGAALSVFVDGQKYSSAVSPISGNVTLQTIGSYSAAIPTYFASMLGGMIFPTLTDNQASELTTLIHQSLGAATKNRIVMFMGDSICGYDDVTTRAIIENGWPYLWLSSVSSASRAVTTGASMAIPASSIGAGTSPGEVDWSVLQPTVINPALASSLQWTSRRLVIALGSNDIIFGAVSATAIVDKLEEAYDLAIAAGATEVDVVSIIPRGNYTAPQEAMRVATNSGIQSRFGSSAIMIPDATMQPGGTSDWSLYQADQVHINSSGNAALVGVVLNHIT